MQIRREILLGVGTPLTMVLIVAFGSIGLLVRMGPATQSILENNVSSLVAVETMMAALAETPPATEEARRRFQKGLDDARAIITESGETDSIEVLAASFRGALAGDALARARSIRSLHELSEVNRGAMERADRDARWFASAGTWMSVVLGTVAFTLGLLALGRLRRRLLDPLTEIYDVVTAPASRELGRRCTATEAFAELREIQSAINRLLDARLRGGDDGGREVSRALLLQLLDDDSLPALALDAEGKLVAANARALELLETASLAEIRERLSRNGGGNEDGETEGTAAEELEATPIGETGGTLVRIRR